MFRVAPRVGQPRTAGVVDDPARRLRRARADHLEPDAVVACNASRRAVKVASSRSAERAVVEEQRPEVVAVDRDVAHRLGDDRCQVHRLAREEIDLAEEAGGAVADDLVPCRVEDRRLALQDRDERIPAVADAKEHVADGSRPLLAVTGERVELRIGQHRSGRARQAKSLTSRR